MRRACTLSPPSQTLGIPRDADFKKIQQAYNNKRRDAKNDESKLADIEAAYNQLFMTSLTARVQVRPFCCFHCIRCIRCTHRRARA